MEGKVDPRRTLVVSPVVLSPLSLVARVLVGAGSPPSSFHLFLCVRPSSSQSSFSSSSLSSSFLHSHLYVVRFPTVCRGRNVEQYLRFSQQPSCRASCPVAAVVSPFPCPMAEEFGEAERGALSVRPKVRLLVALFLSLVPPAPPLHSSHNPAKRDDGPAALAFAVDRRRGRRRVGLVRRRLFAPRALAPQEASCGPPRPQLEEPPRRMAPSCVSHSPCLRPALSWPPSTAPPLTPSLGASDGAEVWKTVPEWWARAWHRGGEEKALAIAQDPFAVKSITKGKVTLGDADYNMQCVLPPLPSPLRLADGSPRTCVRGQHEQLDVRARVGRGAVPHDA